MNRRHFISILGGAALTWPLAARAQQKIMPLIGCLFSTVATNVEQLAGIRQGLGELGFVEGRNVSFEIRSADGVYDRLPALVAELIARKVDVIIAQAPPAARAAKAATSTIPVVFGVGVDPVAEGLVASLARPGGNLTGAAMQSSDLMPKRLDLLSQLVPAARRFGLLVNPNNPNPWTGALEAAAAKKGAELVVVKAATVAEIDSAFAALVQQGCQALLIGDDTFLSNQDAQIAALMIRHRLPTINNVRRSTVRGGLLSYGANLQDAYRLVGATAGRILKGAKPADLPVQQPVKFELVINMKAANALGLTVPTLLLTAADEVIE